jgi:hypothetical protein
MHILDIVLLPCILFKRMVLYNYVHNSGCVLLGGLSSATYLKLITGCPGQVHLPSIFLIHKFSCSSAFSFQLCPSLYVN